jgi:hypothetical protein
MGQAAGAPAPRGVGAAGVVGRVAPRLYQGVVAGRRGAPEHDLAGVREVLQEMMQVLGGHGSFDRGSG